MRALLFSNFPDRFLKDSILPKLETRGVSVDKVMLPRNASASPAPVQAEAVLFMHELASHSENDAVRDFATRAGLPMICISRKAALWDDRLPHMEVSIPPCIAAATQDPIPVPAAKPQDTDTGDADMPSNITRSVPTELVEPMLRHMIKLHSQGMSYDGMIPELRQYWKSGSLDRGNQLRSYVGNILKRHDCPDFYKQWVASGRPKDNAQKEAPVVTKTNQTVPPPADKPEVPAAAGKRHGPRPLFLRALDDKQLAKVVAKIMKMRDKGEQYKDILPAVREYWAASEGPQTPEQLTKFMATIAVSPRAPVGFKSWYAKARKHGPAPKASSRKRQVADRFDLPKPKDDAELARIYMEENEGLKKRLEELQAARPKDAGQLKAQLRELFASCQKLVALGAMDLDGTFNMVFQFLDRA